MKTKIYKNLRFKTLLMLFSFWAFSVSAQEYSFEDFVGTWHGNISATIYGGFNDPMTMTIYEDGFYAESTGRLMPSTYPNTQQSEYDAATNRYHWWYLDVVYAGQYFYAHHYYSIVHFQNDTLIMHYNFHNNPEPWPDAGVIFLVKENTNATPPPVNLDLTQTDNLVYIAWDVPENGNQNPDSYNIYVSVEMNDFELLGYTEETQFMVNETAAAGLNEYYVTAVYDTGESDPSESLYVLYETPEPLNLLGEPQTGEIAIEWSAPDFDEVLPAAFYGYNVYHKYEDGTYEVVQFTEDLNFVHENPVSGTHFYYVTAVYNGGESEPSNEIEVSYVISSPSPANLNLFIEDDVVYLVWDNPESGSDDPTGYNVYVSVEMANFELMGNTQDTSFIISENAAAGFNEYYVTAIYESGESDPSESLYVLYETPEPLNLLGEPQTGEIAIEWSAPAFGEVLPAAFYGYNVYHKYEDGTFEFVQFTEDLNFVHENPAQGMHYYYVTAVYNGGESDPSNEIEVSYVISSLGKNLVSSARIYPNPASDFVTIQAEENIYEISIFNQQGQLILQEESKLQQMRINISDLPAGLYTLKLKAENRVTLKKLIKN